MNPFLYLHDETSAESFDVRKVKVAEYIRTTPDLNQEYNEGYNLLMLAIGMQLLSGYENLAEELLDRGADPNRPSSLDLVTSLVRSMKVERPPLSLLKKLIEKGMELNHVYDVDDPDLPCQGMSTLLDYLDASLEGISPKRKRLNALANKYAGGLGGVRNFLGDAIAMLESHGAKRAAGFWRRAN